LTSNKMINTELGYFKVLKPMIKKYDIKHYQVNGILSKWIIREFH
jgi:hypothetical protein